MLKIEFVCLFIETRFVSVSGEAKIEIESEILHLIFANCTGKTMMAQKMPSRNYGAHNWRRFI